MKTVFKPLGLAAAVAAVTAGYAGAVSAQEVSSRNVGDLGLIPYYSVVDGFATAIHIINTSSYTQVVKLRARRGLDSMDSLDFNIIMSPEDVWVGSMTQKDDGQIVITTNDSTCTAPLGKATGVEGQVEFVMPDQESISTLIDFREGAEEGYIEVIGMAQPADEANSAIAYAAKHVDGVPRDCAAVRSNFFRVPNALDPLYMPGDDEVKGVHSPAVTAQTCSSSAVPGCDDVISGLALNDYVDTKDDAFKVSWAVTDGNSGLEIGSNAVHIEGFAADPMMTNQQVLLAGDVDALGYLFPDLDGGSPLLGVRGLFDGVIRPLLGAARVQNDWSARDEEGFDVVTDWIVTMPGQYLMVDPQEYIAALQQDDPTLCEPDVCDWRDIPVNLNITFFNREERGFTPEEGGLVVSPAINVSPDGINLPNEVNVVNWNNTGDTIEAIIESQYGLSFAPEFEFDRGWANLQVLPAAFKDQSVWDYTIADPNTMEITGGPVAVINEPVPIIGFAAWGRAFTAAPLANYGRAIDHSYGS